MACECTWGWAGVTCHAAVRTRYAGAVWAAMLPNDAHVPADVRCSAAQVHEGRGTVSSGGEVWGGGAAGAVSGAPRQGAGLRAHAALTHPSASAAAVAGAGRARTFRRRSATP